MLDQPTDRDWRNVAGSGDGVRKGKADIDQ
jgi:hypothetical protein